MIIVSGDLMNTPIQFVAHQVNCLGAFGAGVAKCIREKHPDVYTQYKELCKESSPEELLGTSYVCKCNNYNRAIINLFGQYQYGVSKRQTDYTALKNAIIDSIEYIHNEYMREDGCQIVIAIPYNMSCGLAGGDWSIVSSMLERIEKDENVLFVAYRLK